MIPVHQTKFGIKSFKEILEKSHVAKKAYSETFTKDNKKGKLVALFAESDMRRYSIIEAMQTNDMDKARYLIWEAKEEVKRNKLVVLDIAMHCCREEH